MSLFNISIKIGNKKKQKKEEKRLRKHRINGNRNNQAGENINFSSSPISYISEKEVFYLRQMLDHAQKSNFDFFRMCLTFMKEDKKDMARPLEDFRTPENERERYITPWAQSIKDWQQKNGFTLADIASILGLSENTVKKKSSNGGYDYTLVDVSKLLERSKTTKYPLIPPFIGEVIEERENAMRQVVNRLMLRANSTKK